MYSEEEVQTIVSAVQEYERICHSFAHGNGVYSHPIGRLTTVLDQMRRSPEIFREGQIPYLENIVEDLRVASERGSATFLG